MRVKRINPNIINKSEQRKIVEKIEQKHLEIDLVLELLDKQESELMQLKRAILDKYLKKDFK